MDVGQPSAVAEMSTCDRSWYLCLGPDRGVYQDISQAAIASMCSCRWIWENCCSQRVSRQDVKVVKQNALNVRLMGSYVRTRGILSPFHAHVSRALLGGLQRIPSADRSVVNPRDSHGFWTFLGISAGRHRSRDGEGARTGNTKYRFFSV